MSRFVPPMILLFAYVRDARPPSIDAHLAAVERQLGEASVARLDPARRARREASLGHLRAYVAAGRYPHNHVLPAGRERTHPVDGAFRSGSGRTPVFVDEHDTPCAVAHLMRASGAHDLVERIRRERNTAFVHELSDVDGVAMWVDESGFTIDELARIQPTYCHTDILHQEIGAGLIAVPTIAATATSAILLANGRRPWPTLAIGAAGGVGLAVHSAVGPIRSQDCSGDGHYPKQARRVGGVEAGVGTGFVVLNALGFVLAATLPHDASVAVRPLDGGGEVAIQGRF
ncbi:MAG: hypothetical protein H6737_21475 [Alphaproteobacteria bacterium]|nr:hypothetical protein [Alphaproteobacteria bacterium]